MKIHVDQIRRLLETANVDSLHDVYEHYPALPQEVYIDGWLALAYSCNKHMINHLLDLGVDVDERDSVNGTLLMQAASNGELELVQYLTRRGADVNATNQDDETSLSFACTYGKVEVATFLIARGADVNAVHRTGGTILDDVTLGKEIQELLIRSGGTRINDG